MILARIVPVDSPRYNRLSQKIKSFDKIMEWLPTELFAIWTIFVAGMAAGKAQIDRFYFWDWSDWLIGFIGIFVITVVHHLLSNFLNVKKISEINLMTKNTTSTIYYTFLVTLLFGLGWLVSGVFNMREMLTYLSLYGTFFASITIIHSVRVENNVISDLGFKNIQTGFGIFFIILCCLFGYSIDEPVVTTAALVSLPFLIVLLFGKHIRHLERAKFYPIFIIAMFVSVREAWFLVPLILLFVILRSYNYLRYQKVFPTFGVTHD